MDALVEYNPETLLAKAGMKVAEKEGKKQIKHFLKDIKKDVKQELDITLRYFGFDSFDDLKDKISEIKDEAMDTVQEVSEYGIGSVINRPLKIIKKLKDLSNNIFYPTGDSSSAKIISKIKEAGVPVSIIMSQGSFNNKPPAPPVNPAAMKQNLMANPYAQRMMANPYAQRMMRGGKREKGPAEEIEETLNMLFNHRLWLFDQAKNRSQAKTKKRTIKKKKMIKNPKKKGTRKGSK